MLLKQAKILTEEQADLLLIYAGSTRHPQRDRLIVLISVKGGAAGGRNRGAHLGHGARCEWRPCRLHRTA